MKHCDNCKFVRKVFDGMYSETWVCENKKLKELIHVLNVGMTMQEREEMEFAVEYGFGCVLHKEKL